MIRFHTRARAFKNKTKAKLALRSLMFYLDSFSLIGVHAVEITASGIA
jgi:hypothetical protein